MGHEKTKESDLNRPLPLTTAAVLKERGKSLIRCRAEGANGFHLLQVPLTRASFSFVFGFPLTRVLSVLVDYLKMHFSTNPSLTSE